MKATIRILIVDDDEDDFFIIKEYISSIKEQHFIVDWCGVYKEAANKICEGKYDLYFVDYLLGAETGLDLIKETSKNNCEAPVILLTGNGNYAIDMKAMEYGAVDYLVKSELTTEKLERCIRYSLERAASTKALRNNERKFRNIFERSKDTVFLANKELVFIDVNDAAVRLLECSKEELTSRSIYDFLANEEDAVYIQHELVSKDSVIERPTDFKAKESGVKNCIVTVSKETDITGEIYYQGIIHEITALKRAEKANLALEKMKMASRLFRTMAHEVRNPLNNIVLSLEQLRLTSVEEEKDLYSDIIGRNAKRIGDLITELLNSARPRELEVKKKSLQSILDETLNAASDRINLQNIRLKKDYIDDHAWVMADCEKLKIALLNIVINAVESMQKDQGELLVSLKKKDEQHYSVAIQDNGCGISSDNLVKLFEPYFTTKQNGLGLGLSSTLNILQSHSASVDVDSQIKKGTIFKIFFNKA